MSSDVVASDPSLTAPAAESRPKRWRRRLAILAASLAALAAAGWSVKTSYFTEAAPPGPRARGPAVTVESALVAKGGFPVTLSGLGTVASLATSVVKSQISGQLQQINFQEGQLVKAGDVLAQVDPRPYRLTLAQAEGQLRRDSATLENAERDLVRYETLRKKMADAVSGQQVDTQRALIEQTRGTVAIDQALVDQARLNLDYTRIVSLIDGQVGLRQVDQGNYVQASDPNGLVVVTQLSPITVVFTLPARDLPAVLKRFRAGEELPVSVYDKDRGKPLARGKLAAIDNQIDPTTGTVKLRALFANEDERLYPNQFVNAEVLVEKLQNVVLAPSAAVQRGAKGAFAYVVGAENTVSARNIVLGPGNGDAVVVESGLREGERVVTLGADRLREGASVTLPTPREAEQAPRKAEGAARDGAEKNGARDGRS
ncbi:MdtA/MuxA family multidrug efflux RND transporter periplasmic adaptor subunit [uncultured Rhodoblastus sp.]|uniref:MdtA/MuxA family multidrug efflux RND transporter periplasmic adaptor subunit n=1 Tax=uncultured Rhodoblastus sp. TaxID=543037 RepID=UPI0025FCD8B3|nr:MdtA/MuxA family multidrug efflux RND transporter periplasmic adaptor subunit [uncultured Rhodoblastus sp.]